ncbi:replication protein A 70 kDa DNA-binding subunit B, partial [Tanacetum coccineum]
MATFISGYINDFYPVKDNIKLRVRIVRTWLLPVYNKLHIKNMELIVTDEHRYSLGEIQPKFRMANKALRLSFLSNTKVETCSDFNGSYHGFAWRPYKSITDLQKEEDGQFVVACEDLDNYDKNGKAGKKKPLTFLDDEGNEINCTLWGDFTQQLTDFLNT